MKSHGRCQLWLLGFSIFVLASRLLSVGITKHGVGLARACYSIGEDRSVEAGEHRRDHFLDTVSVNVFVGLEWRIHSVEVEGAVPIRHGLRVVVRIFHPYLLMKQGSTLFGSGNEISLYSPSSGCASSYRRGRFRTTTSKPFFDRFSTISRSGRPRPYVGYLLCEG